MSITIAHEQGEKFASVPVIALSDKRAKHRAIRRLETRIGADVTEDDVLWVSGLVRKQVVVKLD